MATSGCIFRGETICLTVSFVFGLFESPLVHVSLQPDSVTNVKHRRSVFPLFSLDELLFVGALDCVCVLEWAGIEAPRKKCQQLVQRKKRKRETKCQLLTSLRRKRPCLRSSVDNPTVYCGRVLNNRGLAHNVEHINSMSPLFWLNFT